MKNNIKKTASELFSSMMRVSLLAIIFVFVISCSETTSPDNQADVVIRTELSKQTVSKIDLKFNEQFQKSNVDSLQITKVRILLKEIKLHKEAESDDSKDEKIKVGPYVFVGDSTGKYFDLANGVIPSGTFNKIKFEIHRFSSGEIATYASNSTFKDFADNGRYSVIIEGNAFKSGVPTRFTYKSDVTANLSLKFPNSIVLDDVNKNYIYLQINPVDLMKSGTFVFDPNDTTNKNDIDNLTKSAIKALKK